MGCVFQPRYTTGWRIASELILMEWHRVDSHLFLHPRAEGPSGRRRGRLRSGSSDGVIWSSRTSSIGLGGPFGISGKAWQNACLAAGCPGRIPRDMRRSAIRAMGRAGISENVVMKLSGHKRRAVLDRYAIVSGADLSTAAQKLAAASGTRFGTSRGKSTAPVAVSA